MCFVMFRWMGKTCALMKISPRDEILEFLVTSRPEITPLVSQMKFPTMRVSAFTGRLLLPADLYEIIVGPGTKL